MIKEKNNEGIVQLYDDYYLTIGEIASLYNISYYSMWLKIQKLPIKTNKKEGRRNSSYGKHFSEERKNNISKSLIGKTTGRKSYERTPEIKEKISNSLKKYYMNNKVSESTRKKLSQAWAEGKYKNAKMGRGIQGYFYSYKMNKDMYFRSLLELSYLIYLEENEQIYKYEIEPFQIQLNYNNEIHHYTPDFLVNNQILIELKPYNHLSYTKENERFTEEIKSAKEYCQNNNLIYKIIYDVDINFESQKFQRLLRNNPNIIDKYNIRFNKPIEEWSLFK